MDKCKIIQAWVSAGMKDFYIGFELGNRWPGYACFFCHQGLEKICKAYVLLEFAIEWEHLPETKAFIQVENIVKPYSHKLSELLKHLRSRRVLPNVSEDVAFIRGDRSRNALRYTVEELEDILEKAYIEARYPIPPSKQVHKKHPINKGRGLYNNPISETAPIEYARKAAVMVLKRIESDFSVTISMTKEEVSRRIEDDMWTRFENVFFKN